MSSVNDIESASPVIKGVPMSSEQIHAATGTVNLISDEKDVVLVPAPSSDPRDPLNLSTPRKWAIAVILSLYSCTGLTVVSAAGALISFFLEDYVEAGKSYNDIVHLITIPTLSMGLGNLLFVPMALAVGRRPIYLFSCALLFIACIIAGQNTNYEYHLAIRIVIGFAAGQSEALVPLMLKESFFLHERANILSFQSSFQAIIGCALSICSSNIAASYNVYAGISGAIFVASVLLVPETKFDRPLEAYNGLTATTPGAAGVNLSKESVQRWEHPTGQVTEATRPPLDHSLGKAWSLKTMLNPMPSVTVNWAESWALVKHMLTMIMFPNLFLVIITNAWFLGVNVAQGTTYGTVLTGPGYHWADKWTGQIVVALIALPTLGFMSDRLITFMARRNGGVHEPEVRLIPLVFPIVIGVFSCVLFGYTYDNPEKVHWFAIPFTYAGVYYAFIAASVCGQTYLLDAYPTRAGSVLALVCSCRGVISFGLNYSLTPTTDKLGHLGTYSMYGGVMAFLGVCTLSMFWFGRRLRLFTLKFVVDKADVGPRYG